MKWLLQGELKKNMVCLDLILWKERFPLVRGLIASAIVADVMLRGVDLKKIYR